MLRAAATAVALAANVVAQLYPGHQFSIIEGPLKKSPVLEVLNRSCQGNVPCGMPGIWQCRKPGHIAITFDDGPFQSTKLIKQQFDVYGYNATFFITGKNRGRRIDDFQSDYPVLIRNMTRDGHQVASHTWTHRNLDHDTFDWDIRNEMLDNERALGRVLDGYVPTYMRPPYAVCGQRCSEVLNGLGYKVIMFNIDTTDYKYNDEHAIDKAIEKFNAALASNRTGSYIVLNHDQEWTAKKLVPVMLKQVRERGYKAVTVGDCLDDPVENWYRQAPLQELKRAKRPFHYESVSGRDTKKLKKNPGDKKTNVHLPPDIESLVDLNDAVDRMTGKPEPEPWTPPGGDEQKWRNMKQGSRKTNSLGNIQRRHRIPPESEIKKDGREAMRDLQWVPPSKTDPKRNIRLPPEVAYNKWYSKQVDRMLKPDRKKDLEESHRDLWARSDVDLEKLPWEQANTDRAGEPLQSVPRYARFQKWLTEAEHGAYDRYTQAPSPDWDSEEIGQSKKRKREASLEGLTSKLGCSHKARRGVVPRADDDPNDGCIPIGEPVEDEKAKHPDAWHDWH